MSVKFNIINPKFSSLERGSAIILFNFLVIASIVSVALQFSTNKVPLILTLSLCLITIIAYFLGKRILSYNTRGVLTIKSDQLEIQSGESIESFPYDKIEKIEYCGNIPDSLIVKSTSNHGTYIIKIEDINHNSTLIEVTKESVGSTEVHGTCVYIEQTLIDKFTDSKILFNPKIKVHNIS